MKAYAGIGARKISASIASRMEELGTNLASKYVLRSGGAFGSDRAFEKGCDLVEGSKEIYLANDATAQSIELAAKFHPAWEQCSRAIRKLMGRNMMIMLGKNLDDPVEFVVCWTEQGMITGGTGQGLRVAKHYNIPIYNLHHSLYPELDSF